MRGLDYYTKPCFEFVSDSIGAQGHVCGGGRYDGLIEELGGQPTPRLASVWGLKGLCCLWKRRAANSRGCGARLFIVALGERQRSRRLILQRICVPRASAACTTLTGVHCAPQMKYADKLGAKYTIVIGDNEVDEGVAKLKDMKNGTETELAWQPL